MLAAAIADIPLPIRMRKLPISDKGFPIPAFVAWLNAEGNTYVREGTPDAVRDFRVINHHHVDRCYRLSRCWICNEPLGVYRVFAIGPMCAVSRVTMEPPSHRDCVEYATRACPFMMRPRMRRNEKDKGYDRSDIPGLHLDRNPGVFCLWQTPIFSRFEAEGGMLCRLGPPQRVDWISEGRPATRQEVMESIDSGMPFLRRNANTAELMESLERGLAQLDKLLPTT